MSWSDLAFHWHSVEGVDIEETMKFYHLYVYVVPYLYHTCYHWIYFGKFSLNDSEIFHRTIPLRVSMLTLLQSPKSPSLEGCTVIPQQNSSNVHLLMHIITDITVVNPPIHRPTNISDHFCFQTMSRMSRTPASMMGGPLGDSAVARNT